MKNILFIATLCFYCVIFSQETEQKSPWSLGGVIAPTYGYRTLNYSSPNEFIETLRNEKEGGQFGYHTSFRVKRQINTNWTMELGAGYASRNYKIKREELTNETSSENDLASIQSNVQYRFWEIPLIFKYTFHTWEQQRFYILAGLNFAKFRTQITQTKLLYADDTKESYLTYKNGGFNSFDLAPQIGLGWTCLKNERFQLDLSPFFQFSLISIEAQKNQKEHLFQGGVNVGFYFGLGR